MSRFGRSPGRLLFSLRGRLLFLICLATLPAILFAFVVAQNERSAALTRMEREAEHVATLASREHAHQIRGARELLQWLGEKVAREGDQSPVLTDPDFLRALLAGHPQLANIGVLSADGRVQSSAYPLASYRDWRDNPAYQAAIQSNQVEAGTYLVSPIFERPTLNHAYAVRDSAGRIMAVLFNGLNLDWLARMASGSHLPYGTALTITDRDGRILAYGGGEELEIAGMDAPVIPGLTQLSSSDTGRTLELGNGGVERYFVGVPLEEAPGLYVGAGLPFQHTMQTANTAFYRTLLGLGVLTLFTISAVFVAAELGILRGLRSLSRAAQRLAEGNLSARVMSTRGHDELAMLGVTFNRMADSLEARHREAADAQQQLRGLARRLQMAREEEASRISRELHDEIGQTLTSLKMHLSNLESCCTPERGAEACTLALREFVQNMNTQIGEAIDFVRRISSELRPGVLDKLGLNAALDWLAGETQAHADIVVEVDSDFEDANLDEVVSITLFRIAQEALTNVLRHAGAECVVITLAAKDRHVVMMVRDDGRGMDGAEANALDSLGIIGMRERAVLVGGTLSIESTPGAGTTVRVEIPLAPDKERTDAHSAR